MSDRDNPADDRRRRRDVRRSILTKWFCLLYIERQLDRATGARSFGAHAGMQSMPHAVARDGARVAAADAGDAGGRRSAAGEAGAISGAGAEVDAMDLGSGVRAGGDGRICAVHGLHRALGAAIARRRDSGARVC